MALGKEILIKDPKVGFLNQEKYRKLFERSSDGILVLDDQFVFVECNKRSIEILGYRRKDLIGLTPMHISPQYQPDGSASKELINLDLSKTIEGGDHRIEWVLTKKDGTEVPVEIALSVFESDQKSYIYAFINDLSEIREKEQDFYESEERFRTLFNQSSDAIMIYDPVGGFINCNPAGLSLLKVKDQEQLVGVHPWEISPLTQPDGSVSEVKAKENHEQCLREGFSRFEWFLKDPEGSDKWLDVALTRIQVKSRKLIHVLFRDITNLKDYQSGLEKLVLERTQELELANKELMVSNEELELINEQMHIQSEELERAFEKLKLTQGMLVQSEKVSSLNMINAGIGHELNNPLNFIRHGVGILKKELKGINKDQKDRIVPIFLAIEEGVARIIKINESLNRFIRDREEETKNIDLHQVINDALLLVNYQLDSRILIRKNFHDGEFTLNGNEGRLHQVILNLLLNAIQSITGKGEISITTTIHGQMLFIEIEDTGSGIEKEHLPKVFDPFFTTKAPGIGTGLGLSIASEIIQKHQGEMFIDSKVNEGTKVVISFPMLIEQLNKSNFP